MDGVSLISIVVCIGLDLIEERIVAVAARGSIAKITLSFDDAMSVLGDQQFLLLLKA